MNKFFIFTGGFLFLILKLQFLFLFYLNFTDRHVKEIEAKVVTQYKKNNYYVLKLKNREVTFYTISRDELKNLLNDTVKIKIFTGNIAFLGFLTKFYATSYDLKLQPLSVPQLWIEKQHSDKSISNLFRALFFGESIDYKTRISLSTLGLSHLFALSGLHLGFISVILFFLFSPFYMLFHKKFPYRNRYVDLGMFILTVEFLYLFYTGFPPSLIRAYFMEVIFFIFAFLFEDVLSVKVLFFTVLFGLLIFTFSILSIGFLLSVLGVYYIYLFLRYFKISWKNTPLLSVYMFLMMFVWSHYFFGQFNNYQFFSPVFNLLFPFFYVIEILLHVFGIGGLFDGLIKDLLDLGKNFYYVKFELPVLLIFALLSILAYKKKPAFYGINLLAFILVFSSVRI